MLTDAHYALCTYVESHLSAITPYYDFGHVISINNTVKLWKLVLLLLRGKVKN